ncbi:MAG: threonine--tRNA ligase [Myxococcota bacterium]
MNSSDSNAVDHIEVQLPSGDSCMLPAGSTAWDLARQLSTSLAEKVVAAWVHDQLVDLRDPLPNNCQVELLKAKDPRCISVLRHSCEHILATAVCKLFPGAQVTMGPKDHDADFYYDFDIGRAFSPDDLQAIEQEMGKLIDNKLPFSKCWVSKQEAYERFEQLQQRFKPEILDWIASDEVTLYQSGDFVDLCRGPHLPHAGFIRAFQLLGTSACHWRGDPKRESLQRIRGIAFADKKQLKEHLQQLQQAQQRDHRRLGVQHQLFCMSQTQVGPGLIMWLPKGGRLRATVEEALRKAHQRAGYEIVYSPHVAKSDLWKLSGHWDFYRDSMFSPMDVDGQQYLLKPMNCPFHILMYKNSQRSWRELPMRLAELGTVYRYELGGVMHGLLRVRGFTQDDAHIFCRWNQLQAEIVGVLQLTVRVLNAFGFEDFEVHLATRPEKFVGEPQHWDQAQQALKQAVQHQKLPMQLDEGGGAFYGPKIDLKLKDCLGRLWQCSTVQLDFNNPQRFDLSYIDDTGKPQQPVMLHRALLGSVERFIGILIEHHAAAFPFWLSPEQVRLLTVADRHDPYARQLQQQLHQNDIRVHLPTTSDTLGAKIRQARLDKVPLLAIVGDKETQQQTVSVRQRGSDKTDSMTQQAFVQLCLQQNQCPL